MKYKVGDKVKNIDPNLKSVALITGIDTLRNQYEYKIIYSVSKEHFEREEAWEIPEMDKHTILFTKLHEILL